MDKINFKKPGMHQPKTNITGSKRMYKDVVRKFDGYYKLMRKNLAYKHTNLNLTYYELADEPVKKTYYKTLPINRELHIQRSESEMIYARLVNGNCDEQPSEIFRWHLI